MVTTGKHLSHIFITHGQMGTKLADKAGFIVLTRIRFHIWETDCRLVF